MFRHKITAIGALGAFTFGCHSVKPPPATEPPVKQVTSLYPGIPAPQSREIQQASAVEVAQHAAPAQATDYTLDLDVALRLAGVENPTINLAREVVREALADQLAARSLLLPSVNLGGNLRLHRGSLLAATGLVREVNLQSLYLGGGAGVAGAGTAALPGVRLFAHLGDAAYEPLAAQQRVNVRRGEAQAVQNNILLDVAAGYLALVGAEARLEILRRGETDLAEITRLTEVHAKAGQGRQADAHRAESHLELLRTDIHRAEEEVAVAAAGLCRLLSLDPSISLRTPGGSVRPFRLIPESDDLESLIADALRSRPEMVARSAAILEAQTRVRQERVRPWLPMVSVGYSYGGFGGGSDQAQSGVSSWGDRSEFDVVAVWTLQNLGLGNRSRVRMATSNVGIAVAGYDGVVNLVRREVTEAQADARATATQIETAETALTTAEDGFKLETERIKQGQGRPIEVLDSFRQLLDARQDLLRAVVAFDVAQFRLFVAVGRTP